MTTASTPVAALRGRLRLHHARLRGLATLMTPEGRIPLRADPALLLADLSALLDVLAQDVAQLVVLADDLDDPLRTSVQ